MADGPKEDRCSVCEGWFKVRADGMIRYHGPHPKPCPGGGRPPFVPSAEMVRLASPINLETFEGWGR